MPSQPFFWRGDRQKIRDDDTQDRCIARRSFMFRIHGCLLVMVPNLRARVMLSIAYGCGLRASEVTRLKVGDIDSDQGIIWVVQSKGKKDRNVMLPAEILGLLREWWKERPNRKDAGVPMAERRLFPSRKGHGAVTARQFSRILENAVLATKPVIL